MPGQFHPRGAILPADVVSVGADPLVQELIGRLDQLCVVQVLGEHEMAVIEQARDRFAVGEVAGYRRSVVALGDEADQGAFSGLGREEMVTVVQVEEFKVRLEISPGPRIWISSDDGATDAGAMMMAQRWKTSQQLTAHLSTLIRVLRSAVVASVSPSGGFERALTSGSPILDRSERKRPGVGSVRFAMTIDKKQEKYNPRPPV